MEQPTHYFEDLGLCDSLLDGLDAMGFQSPTPIQAQVIPLILDGRDLIACAQTGTGKTAAYLLPVLDKISRQEIPHTSALVIAPTRELALQIDQALQGFSYFTHASSIPIYGGNDGMSFDREKRALTDGASIIVATPGRLLSHLNLGYVRFDQLDTLILDEADKMLDMGFLDDILRIISFLPKQRQNLMFSATMPPKIRELAKRILQDPAEVNIALSKPAAGVDQKAYVVYETQKGPLLLEILKQHADKTVIVFASRKVTVKQLEKELRQAKLPVEAIHSDLAQEERENVLLRFRSRTTRILVATDILSRGIDIENIGMVINYDVPGDAEDYVHRVGRTARAATTGEAITLISELDQRRFGQIESLIEATVPKMPLPEKIGSGPAYDPGRRPPGKGRPSGKGGRFNGRSGRGHRGKGGAKPAPRPN
ncbi:MAG: DEAD/DEAH box helicase [Bacteroidota bacterium]|uniref:DEAD/DEAH box helicase n=1 Tax=Candidatus Pollutiaquabacter sp. TaxID=3416354 RepID=UPI002C4BDB38|nr:DEAD/DEAH box helicase [Bacteroidia bacterium]